MLPVHCPSCSRALNLPETVVGQQVQCPICRHVFQPTGETAPLRPQSQGPVARFEEDLLPSRRPYPSLRRRDHGNAPRPGDGRTAAAVWLLIAGIIDTVVIPAIYLFLFGTGYGSHSPAIILIVTILLFPFYLPALVLVFITAGVMRTARGKGLIITGCVMTFIVAVELLIVSAIIVLGLLRAFRTPGSRGRVWEDFVIYALGVLVVAVPGIISSIIAGIKGLIAVSRFPPRRPGYP